MADVERVNKFLKDYLRRTKRCELTAVEANQLLDEAGILGDSRNRPGLPLRRLLRAGKICCAGKKGRFWFIRGCCGNR